jgi:phosphonate transport system substrate-binding protein
MTWARAPVLLLACLLVTTCGDNETAKKIDFSQREDVTVQRPDNAITYAYLPQYAHTLSYRRHHMLVDYLSHTTGLSIRQVFPDTFDEHMHMVGRGLIDLTFSNPFIYIRIADRYGARAFARIIESQGNEDFRGQIICRADNTRIKSLADLKGKRLIAVDPTSAGGYLYPWGYLLEQGLRKEDFAEISFAPGPGGKQEKVVMAVYSGKYDVGLIREGTLNVLGDKVDLKQIRVLGYSPWYPGWLYAARGGLDPAVVEKVKRALLALNMDHPKDKVILEKAGFIGVVPASDEDFESVRRLARIVESGGKN